MSCWKTLGYRTSLCLVYLVHTLSTPFAHTAEAHGTNSPAPSNDPIVAPDDPSVPPDATSTKTSNDSQQAAQNPEKQKRSTRNPSTNELVAIRPGSWFWSQKTPIPPTAEELAFYNSWAEHLAQTIAQLNEHEESGNALYAYAAKKDLPDYYQQLIAARMAAGQRVHRGTIRYSEESEVTFNGLPIEVLAQDEPLLPPAPAGQPRPDGTLEIVGRDKDWTLRYDPDQPNPLQAITTPANDLFWNVVAASPGLPVLVETQHGQRLVFVDQADLPSK